ncbi:MAG: hypothetical protein LBS12_01510, partial [Prevotellaceae bacterium]|nr:hypothetical protein [Prevotellaceae bacterium]
MPVYLCKNWFFHPVYRKSPAGGSSSAQVWMFLQTGARFSCLMSDIHDFALFESATRRRRRLANAV